MLKVKINKKALKELNSLPVDIRSKTLDVCKSRSIDPFEGDGLATILLKGPKFTYASDENQLLKKLDLSILERKSRPEGFGAYLIGTWK